MLIYLTNLTFLFWLHDWKRINRYRNPKHMRRLGRRLLFNRQNFAQFAIENLWQALVALVDFFGASRLPKRRLCCNSLIALLMFWFAYAFWSFTQRLLYTYINKTEEVYILENSQSFFLFEREYHFLVCICSFIVYALPT